MLDAVLEKPRGMCLEEIAAHLPVDLKEKALNHIRNHSRERALSFMEGAVVGAQKREPLSERRVMWLLDIIRNYN